MKEKIFLIHGIRSKDLGAASMGGLAEELIDSFDFVKRVNYGYVLIPISNKKAVSALTKELDKHNEDDHIIVVAYSNGCWATVQAAELGYKIDHMVLISPALHRYHAFPEQVKRVDVYYGSGDNIVEAGLAYSTFANLMPWNWKIFGGERQDWGAMGKYGYQGNDPRVHNWEMEEYVSHFWYKYKIIVDGIAQQLKVIYNKVKK